LASKFDVISYGLVAQILAFALAFTHNLLVGFESPNTCTEKFGHEVGLRMRGLAHRILSKMECIYSKSDIYTQDLPAPP
jgi:hypothetical protein